MLQRRAPSFAPALAHAWSTLCGQAPSCVPGSSRDLVLEIQVGGDRQDILGVLLGGELVGDRDGDPTEKRREAMDLGPVANLLGRGMSLLRVAYAASWADSPVENDFHRRADAHPGRAVLIRDTPLELR